ncbi:iron-sulfur cluster assembly scaffold protein [Candidatus Bipolaricaulota bacterium]|nr:iron-sulfur cluster assembly scaffold protein [Candidatus Bipolaricaulota bacterium]MBS3791051.1 iron-sulfur cluster assembly scaffold protein [Candidatus Bipolaricaulota bacterium]
MYSEKVMEHFNNPQNQRKMEDPDAIGKVGNALCGDVMWIYVEVGENEVGKEIIEDISWETFGCTAAIATSSMVTELAKGETLEKALEITNEKVAEELDGLPSVKMHCSNLAADGLVEAIYNYLDSSNKEIPEDLRKRHEQIEQHMEKVQEEYGDYVEMEEEMHRTG